MDAPPSAAPPEIWTDRTTRPTLMAIGAHADDIESRVAGTLLKYMAHGYRVVYVLSTNNMSGNQRRLTQAGRAEKIRLPWHEIMPIRRREAAAAAARFGTEPIHLDHPQRHYTRDDGAVGEVRYGSERPACVAEDVPSIVTAQEDEASIRRVTGLILEHQPEAVFTHGGPMANVEHFATQVLVTRAYWRAVEAGYEGMLLHWHDLGVNLFAEAYKRWDSFVDISEQWEAKLEVYGLHASQKPDPRRLDWPQWGPTCGCAHAEVFTIVGRNRQPKQYGAFTLEILQNER